MMDKLHKNQIVISTHWVIAAAVSAVVIISMSLINTVGAADADAPTERITLSPSSVSLKVDAGLLVSGSMKVVNDGDVAYGFSVYARPYGVLNEMYEADFSTQNSNASVYKWVQFDQTKYQIEPGQSLNVKYTIRVPSNAAPGGHYGVLFAETDEKQVAGTGIARKKRVGNLLYVTVNGSYISKGQFKEFILPFWQTSAPVVSSARIENSGNVDFRAKVSTTAKDLFGNVKYSYTGDPIVLPETIRLVEMAWKDAPNFGFFKVEQTVEFLDGKHQNSGYVLIAPRWAPVVLVIIIAIGAAYAVLRWRKDRS